MSEEQLRIQLDAVYASSSWRLTAPLRFFVRVLRSLKGGLAHPMTSSKTVLVLILMQAARYPRLKAFGERILGFFPKLRQRLKWAVRRAQMQAANSTVELLQAPPLVVSSIQIDETPHLNPEALRILQALQDYRRRVC